MTHKHYRHIQAIAFDIPFALQDHLTCITRWYMTIVFNPARLVIHGVPDDIC